jgi:hypothetical protein
MDDYEKRLDQLQSEVRRLRAFLVGLGALPMLVGIAVAARLPARAPEVLRARGLIIEDEHGRERILIGAPVPYAANRVRTDTARVRRLWAPRFPPQYMDYYRGYRHAVIGMIVLDEQGIDRMAIGDSVPDPNIGKRIGPSVGLLLNDANGFERSGYGLLTVRGRDRVVLGLDSNHGTEGATFVLVDSGRTGMSVGDGRHSVFIGAMPPEARVNPSLPFFGIQARAGDTVTYQLDLTKRQ